MDNNTTINMPHTLNNNKRIVKNTIYLYFRMIFTIVLGLYMSRIVLQTLGISDYGIYNVVGGIVTMLTFLNAGMVASSQRFISYELGKNDKERLKNVFCTSVNIHLLIAVIAFIFAETLGLWFVNYQLNIDSDRMFAANCVYQCSIFTFIANVISVPYNSCIVAHEKMSAFAYISILDATLKFAVALLLYILPFDKLIVFSLLLLVVSIFIRFCYTIYCKKHFKECVYHFKFDKYLFKEMFSFAGWSFLGNLGFSFKDQASNVILNLFYGTTLNAARGIGIQVSSIVNTFSNNFTMSLNPQITKQYASGNVEESMKLVYAGSRYTFYLLTLISIPVINNVDYILQLWLGVVPEYTSYFLILSLITGLLYAVSGSVTIALQATGKIKTFQIGICILMLLEFPLAYLLLYLGYPPYSVMYPTLFSYTIAIFFRFYLIKHLVPSYSFHYYIFHVLTPCLIVFIISWITCYYFCLLFETNFLSLLLTSLLSFITIFLVIFIVGINCKERAFVLNNIKKHILKF